MTKERTGLGAVCAVALGVAAVSAGPAFAADAVMKIGTPTINDNQHEWMKRFESRVEERLGDQLDVQTYPASQLGPIPRMIEGLQYGTVEGFVAPPFFFSGLESRNSVLATYGLFTSMDNCWDTVEDDKFRSQVFPLMEDDNIMALSVVCTAPQGLITKQPVESLEDLEGLKVRVLASDFEIEPLKAIGMNPVPMPLNEVVPALERGVIDSVSSSMLVFQGFKMNTVAPHVTMTDLYYFIAVVYVSKSWFDGLPEDVQTALREEARAVEGELKEWNPGKLEGLDEAWTSGGGTISDLPEADQEELQKQANEATQRVLSDQPELNEFYESLLAVAEEHR